MLDKGDVQLEHQAWKDLLKALKTLRKKTQTSHSFALCEYAVQVTL